MPALYLAHACLIQRMSALTICVSAYKTKHADDKHTHTRTIFSETCERNMRLRNQKQTCVCKKHTYADLNNVYAVIVMFACVSNQRMGVNNLACEENYYDGAHFPTETSVQNSHSRNNEQVDVGKLHSHVRKSFADVLLCTLTWK